MLDEGGKGKGEEKGKGGGVWVVHNYGHGGYGYQASYGCAQVAAGLVREVLEGMDGPDKQA